VLSSAVASALSPIGNTSANSATKIQVFFMKKIYSAYPKKART